MGTLYLVDAFNNVVSSSLINDTVNLPGGGATHPIRGSFVINLPFDVPLDGLPTNAADLVSKKYIGMLASYPGYANIIYDEQLDSSGWNTAYNVGTGARFFGSRKSVALGGSVPASMNSQTAALGSAPSIAVFRWELFTYAYVDTGGLITRTVSEEDPGTCTASVSFNGVTSFAVTSGVPFEVPFGQQGSSFRFTLANSSGSKVWVGAWSLIY